MKNTLHILTVVFTIIGLVTLSSYSLAATKPVPKNPLTKKASVKIKKFTSTTDFKNYFKTAAKHSTISGGSRMTLASPMASVSFDSSSKGMAVQESASVPTRVSETNVQVAGIDEPDMVKTDGQNLFVSSEMFYAYFGGTMPMVEGSGGTSKRIAPSYYQGITSVIKAFPAQELSKLAEISKQGQLLLKDKKLIVLSQDGLYAYDVSNPSTPKIAWEIKYKNTNLVTARMYKDNLMLVVRDYLTGKDCNLRPLNINGVDLTVKCTDMYHPISQVSDTTTFHIIKIQPNTGSVLGKLSFVGAGYQATVYASDTKMYVTYGISGNDLQQAAQFLRTKTADIIGKDGVARINKVMAYDIEDSSKYTEIQKVLEKALANYSGDEILQKQTELTNRLNSYLAQYGRDMQKTGLVKINIADMTMESATDFPGTPLNQFSLDEYQGNLRIATTIQPNMYFYGNNYSFSSRGQSVSDVYVYDAALNQVGSVKDLGKTETIYAVRFIADKGYVVTFRQTDPFYVLDLKNPKSPSLAGELKIPGYSSYLHPLKDNLILGVGQENGKVKLSLFSVGNAAVPQEVSKYYLEEYWTDVSSNHHAFIQDPKHNIFFLPGGNGGYVISYADGALSLVKTYKDYGVKRAVYMDDIMYFITNDAIVSFNENTWEKISELNIVSTSTTSGGSPCPPNAYCLMQR